MLASSTYRRNETAYLETLTKLHVTEDGRLYALSNVESDDVDRPWSRIAVLDGTSWRLLGDFPDVWITDLTVASESQLQCVSADNKLMKLSDAGWVNEIATPQEVNVLSSIHACADGTVLIGGDRGQIWDGNRKRSLPTGTRNPICAFYSSHQHVYFAGDKGLFGRIFQDEVELFQPGTRNHLNSLSAINGCIVAVGNAGTLVRLKPDKVCEKSQIVDWDIISAAPIGGNALVCVGEDIALYRDGSTSELVIDSDSYPVDAVLFSPDQVAIGCADMSVYLYPGNTRLV